MCILLCLACFTQVGALKLINGMACVRIPFFLSLINNQYSTLAKDDWGISSPLNDSKFCPREG